MPDDNRHIEDESTYPALVKPDLKSDIPAYLTKDSSDAERYIMEQLSTLRQFMDWSVNAHMDTNRNVRRTNGRLLRVEAWRDMFSSWWVLACGVAGGIGAIAGIVEVWQYVATHFLSH